jgi:hypothetical protein
LAKRLLDVCRVGVTSKSKGAVVVSHAAILRGGIPLRPSDVWASIP